MTDESEGVSGNDMFGGGSDPAPADDTSADTADQVDAAAEEAPADDLTQGDAENVPIQEPLADAPMAAAPPAPVAPPPMDPRVLDAIQQANAPSTKFFEMLNQNMARQEQQRQTQAQKQQADFRLQQIEAMRPKMPDPATATAQELLDYAGKNAEYASARTEMQVMEKVRQMMSQELEQKLAPLQEIQAKAMQDEAARNEAYVSNSVEQFARDPRYPFMANPVIQQAYLRHWWATNEANGGNVVAPEVALKDFIAVQRAFSAPAQVKARTDQQNLDANRRAVQQKNGAPAVPRATSAQSGKQGNGKAGEVKAPDWLSGR